MSDHNDSGLPNTPSMKEETEFVLPTFNVQGATPNGIPLKKLTCENYLNAIHKVFKRYMPEYELGKPAKTMLADMWDRNLSKLSNEILGFMGTCSRKTVAVQDVKGAVTFTFPLATSKAIHERIDDAVKMFEGHKEKKKSTKTDDVEKSKTKSRVAEKKKRESKPAAFGVLFPPGRIHEYLTMKLKKAETAYKVSEVASVALAAVGDESTRLVLENTKPIIIKARAVRVSPKHIRASMQPVEEKVSPTVQKKKEAENSAKKLKRAQQAAERKRKREELEKEPGYIKPTPKSRKRKVEDSDQDGEIMQAEPHVPVETDVDSATETNVSQAENDQSDSDDDEDFEDVTTPDDSDASFASEASDEPLSKKSRKN